MLTLKGIQMVLVLYSMGMVCVNSCHFMHSELSVEQTAGGGVSDRG